MNAKSEATRKFRNCKQNGQTRFRGLAAELWHFCIPAQAPAQNSGRIDTKGTCTR